MRDARVPILFANFGDLARCKIATLSLVLAIGDFGDRLGNPCMCTHTHTHTLIQYLYVFLYCTRINLCIVVRGDSIVHSFMFVAHMYYVSELRS